MEPPGAPTTKAIAFKAPRKLVEEAGFSRSLDAHAEVSRRNHLLFEQLCDMHFELSPVLGQISTSRYSDVLRSKLLAKVSDTTAARYLRSVQIFFTTFEELGGDIRNVEAGLLLDTFFSLSRCPEEGPLSNSLNVMKALRWYRKLLGLSPFPDLYTMRPWCSPLQAKNARAFHCRFRSILFWNVRSWTQKRQPLKPSGQEASSLVSVAACAFQTPSTYSGVHFV